jgi:hypothetical protein
MFGARAATRCGLEFFGTDQVVFASDMPLRDRAGALTCARPSRCIESHDLSNDDKRRSTRATHERLLGSQGGVLATKARKHHATETSLLETRDHSSPLASPATRRSGSIAQAHRLRSASASAATRISGPRIAVSTRGRALPVSEYYPCLRGPDGAVHVAMQAGGRSRLVSR